MLECVFVCDVCVLGIGFMSWREAREGGEERGGRGEGARMQ